MFGWRVYENSWLATAVSWIGFVLITGLTIGLVVSVIFGFEIENTVVIVLIFIAAIALFIVLKKLLNKLTDWIAVK